MSERLYFDRPDVYVLADFDSRTGGQARHVVCEHPDGTSYAAQLAASMGVPVRGPAPADEAGRDSQPSDGQEIRVRWQQVNVQAVVCLLAVAAGWH